MRERLYRFRSFWIFPLIALALLGITSSIRPQWSPGVFVLCFAAGVFTWTLLEYVLHRFVFHVQVPLTNPRLREIINVSHLAHHASPRDRNKVLVQLPFGLIVSALIYGLIWAIARNAFVAALVMSGIWAGFLYYEAVHYRVHFSLAHSGLIAWQRRRHFYHHFTNNRLCFGVTSPLWDYVFGTTSSARTSP
jgi:sterol desaturase/sphingolipid hydroxylase (fatty acid hydroxylase superfamily)